jgi:hypothetical protein
VEDNTYLPYSIPLQEDQWIDGSKKRHVLFMIQHSDDPNVEVVEEGDEIVLRTLKPIAKGKELFRKHNNWDTQENVTFNTDPDLSNRETLSASSESKDEEEDLSSEDVELALQVMALDKKELKEDQLELLELQQELQKSGSKLNESDEARLVEVQQNLALLESPDVKELMARLGGLETEEEFDEEGL